MILCCEFTFYILCRVRMFRETLVTALSVVVVIGERVNVGNPSRHGTEGILADIVLGTILVCKVVIVVRARCGALEEFSSGVDLLIRVLEMIYPERPFVSNIGQILANILQDRIHVQGHIWKKNLRDYMHVATH